MKKSYYIYIILFFCFSTQLFSQELSNRRSKIIEVRSDTIVLDSLSVVPGSLLVYGVNNKLIDTSLFFLDCTNALLIASKDLNLKGRKIKVDYRCFPYDFSHVYKNKDPLLIEPDMNGELRPFTIHYGEEKSSEIINLGGLDKRGSISRGISFGNRQDVIVNSGMSMRLSGKLNNEIDIEAAITDNNIPVQPEGNTNQLQEFDKVYIRLSKDSSRLVAGDFVLNRPPGYFMNLQKKAQGGHFETSFALKGNDKKNNGRMSVSTAAAISKGKYAKNTLEVIEGVQGPYRLKGKNNETYIIILSGSEKVYIDGILLTRGEDYDYVIDYNTAEISFTPKNLITKDKRIVVDFEYSDKNYARSLFYSGITYKNNGLSIGLNLFSEQDIKTQSIQQDLGDEEKSLMQSIGDSIQNAVMLNVDSVPFETNMVLYKMVDTLGYDSVFVFSTDPSNAFYRLGFSNVGSNNGNYVQSRSSVNGRAFEWVAPVGGVSRGDYEPVMLLITPKKQQMATLNLAYAFNKNSKASVELALSNNDLNSFSTINNEDDAGYAIKFLFQNKKVLRKDSLKNKWSLISDVNYEWVNKDFAPIERFRDVEFERDWNLGEIQLSDDHLAGVSVKLLSKNNGFVNYQLKAFDKGNSYSAYRNMISGDLKKNGFRMAFNGSIVNTEQLSFNSDFFRHSFLFSKQLKWFEIGVGEAQELNQYRDNLMDTLMGNSISFNEWELFIKNSDTNANKYSITANKRIDKRPMNNGFKEATTAENISASVSLAKSRNNSLQMMASYRRLHINDSALTSVSADNTLLGRIEYYSKINKGLITNNTFYEIGSGLELKKEYSYLKVADGQGVYCWNDYHNYGVEDPDEFEVSKFKDKANYIRVFTPVNEYIKVYSSQFSEVLYFNPSVVWRRKKGIKKFVSRFANRMAYRVDRKSNNIDLFDAYNPFYSEVVDTSLITLNSTFRNTLYLNRTNPKYGMDVTYSDNKGKSLMTNGFDSRELRSWEGNARWNISRKFMLRLRMDRGQKLSRSDFFSERDYDMYFYEAGPEIQLQLNNFFRAGVSFRYEEKDNKLEDAFERAILRVAGVTVQYNRLSKSSLSLKAEYFNISYNSLENTPVAFEMLEGFNAGENGAWTVMYMRTISKYMQLSFSYEGRKSPDAAMVHTGSVRVRANF